MVLNLMSRGLRAVCAIFLALVTMVAFAGSAEAFKGNSGSTSTPDSGSSNGSSGGSAEATVKTCHLYANPTGFGLSCVTPGSGGDAKTIHEILLVDAKTQESLPGCFDTPISPTTMAAEYPDYGPVTGLHYYLQTCITGLDPSKSPRNQPDEQINNQVITIIDGAPRCFNYDEAHHKATPFNYTLQFQHCVMTLTGKQQQVVSGIENRDGQIPNITIAQQPSTRARTNEDVAFVDTETASNGSGTRTPDLEVGGVTLYAVMGAFKIYPYGPDGDVSKTCDGTTPVSSDDTPQTKPNSCWFRYPRSSAGQPGMVYPFRAEADWTVHYRADGVDHVLASFQKYDDIKLPVYDIQTLVIR